MSRWGWPCVGDEDEPEDLVRVPASGMESLRRTHHFQGPCCLCAFLDGGVYTEARIGVVESLTSDGERNQSILNGEYVAVCAKQRCGYYLCLERFYCVSHIELDVCPPRSTPLPPAELIHIYDVERSFRQGDGLFQVMTDVVVRGKEKALKRQDPVEPMLQRASMLKELVLGVQEDRFWTLFVQCTLCKQVTFRQHFAVNHQCPKISTPNTTSRRYHPYNTPKRRQPDSMPATPRFTEILADSPESPGAYYSDIDRLSSPPSVLPSSDDPPTALEFLDSIFGASRSTSTIES
ncbi:hypothetical protein DFP72DRAFT_843027 [Ephemerocybe angulata]|uniref:Uncharacterized protein n=1 Tax=Ephemerocybe angulata TaxID=980116 RepID=A0A8H6I890_9AGAR|nr:hypothetical protein DFP72DRAFT_843027 [Tulosesus angulatus]